MITAIASWDLQQMSGGRFELGLGTQIQPNIEQRYSARWDSPVPQLREYVQAVKAVFHSFQTGERLNFEGKHYALTRLQPFFNPGPIENPDIPVHLGGVGPAMLRLAGEVADVLIYLARLADILGIDLELDTHARSQDPGVALAGLDDLELGRCFELLDHRAILQIR